jgi:hypothetical protein
MTWVRALYKHALHPMNSFSIRRKSSVPRMMMVRFAVTLVILLTFETLQSEAFPAAPLAVALKRKSFNFASLEIPVTSALHDVS